MKLQIIKQELLKVLLLAQEASEKENVNSYYSHFIFETYKNENKIVIKSANRQTTFEESIFISEETKLNIIEDGRFLLPGMKILNIISALHDGLIFLETENFNLKITENGKQNSNIEFNVRMRDIEEFPKEIHSIKNDNYCTIGVLDLLKIIDNTYFAVSSNMKDASMFLTGIFFDVQGDYLTAVATDRNRISICKTEIPNISKLKDTTENDIIIPQKSILFLKKIINRNEEVFDIKVFINEDKIFFQIENITISTNLISGKYYDYKRIIPEGKRNRIIINTLKLKESISRVTVATDNKKENNVLINIENNNVIISAEEKEKSTAKDKLEAKVEGNNSKFLIKSPFILDPLSIIKTENVIIEYGDSNRDLIKIVSTDEEDETMHIAAQLNQ